MRKISKQILSLFLALMLVISVISVNTSYAAADNAAIEAQIIKELETILDTMDLTVSLNKQKTLTSKNLQMPRTDRSSTTPRINRTKQHNIISRFK